MTFLQEHIVMSKAQKRKATINILNCIGNPALSLSLSQNIDSDTIMIEGLQQFT